MRAIVVKWIGCSETKPARYKVSASRVKPKYFSRGEFTLEEAVMEYVRELGWHGKWCEGILDYKSTVFVCVSKENTITVKG